MKSYDIFNKLPKSCNINFSKEEFQDYVKHLERVNDWFEALEDTSTKNRDEYFKNAIHFMDFRKDEASETDQQEVIKNASVVENNCFVVNSTKEQEES